MSCELTENISLLIDGELETAQKNVVERHLLQCSECAAARADFLDLRRQVMSYNSQIDTAAVQAALANVLSQSGSGAGIDLGGRVTPRREKFAAFFGADRFSVFNPRFGFAAAILTIAFLLGGIALLRNKPLSEVANSNATNTSNDRGKTATPLASHAPETTAPLDEVAQNFRPKSAKPAARDGRRSKPLENKANKPVRERGVPAPPVRSRVDDGANYAAVIEDPTDQNSKPVNRVDSEMLTASHLEQSELLLRSFRNIRTRRGAASEIHYERERAQRLLFRNIVLRREAEKDGDPQVAALLGSLEPILLDIANLRDKPHNEELSAIKDRMERKSLVALLQINSTAIARAYE